jgi:hypothetical protein
MFNEFHKIRFNGFSILLPLLSHPKNVFLFCYMILQINLLLIKKKKRRTWKSWSMNSNKRVVVERKVVAQL